MVNMATFLYRESDALLSPRSNVCVTSKIPNKKSDKCVCVRSFALFACFRCDDLEAMVIGRLFIVEDSKNGQDSDVHNHKYLQHFDFLLNVVCASRM